MSSDESTNEGGRSNSFFFLTEDKKYMVKTISTKEMNVLLEILPGYFEHLRTRDDNFQSLLSLLQGVYTFDIKRWAKIHLIVMSNAVVLKDPLRNHVSHKFDIKGSRYQRKCLPNYFSKLTKLTKSKFVKTYVLKDLDFIYLMKELKNTLVNVNPEDKKYVLNCIKHDTEFL